MLLLVCFGSAGMTYAASTPPIDMSVVQQATPSPTFAPAATSASTADPTASPLRLTPDPTSALPSLSTKPVTSATSAPTPKPTPRLTPRPTRKPTPEPTPELTPEPTPAATPHPTPTPTPSPISPSSHEYTPAPDALAGRLLRHGDRSKAWVALSFDDCYNTAAVRQIAAILREQAAPGAFFPVSDAVVASPGLWQSIAADFPVGNHTQHHAVLTRLDRNAILDEVAGAQELITRTLGRDPLPVFRPPDGALNATVMDAAQEMKLGVVTWDVDTRDWQRTTTAEDIINSALAARNGSVILMHAARQSTIEALPLVIAGLRERGFEIVGLDKLLGLPW